MSPKIRPYILGSAVLIFLMGVPELEAATQAQVLADVSAKIEAASDLSPQARDFVRAKLLPLCTNKVFVDAVKAQNAKKIPHEEIGSLMPPGWKPKNKARCKKSCSAIRSPSSLKESPPPIPPWAKCS